MMLHVLAELAFASILIIGITITIHTLTEGK